MHNKSKKLQVKNRKVSLSGKSFHYSFYYLLSTKMVCGWAVHSLRTAMSISRGFIPSPAFCINFVRRVCVTYGHYTQVIRRVFPQNNSELTSVITYLYPSSTYLTIRATFK
jgi:hypothetical protein